MLLKTKSIDNNNAVGFNNKSKGGISTISSHNCRRWTREVEDLLMVIEWEPIENNNYSKFGPATNAAFTELLDELGFWFSLYAFARSFGHSSTNAKDCIPNVHCSSSRLRFIYFTGLAHYQFLTPMHAN